MRVLLASMGLRKLSPPPTRQVDSSAGSRSPAFARNFNNHHRLAHLGRCARSGLLRSRLCFRTPLFALRSTTAAQTRLPCKRIHLPHGQADARDAIVDAARDREDSCCAS